MTYTTSSADQTAREALAKLVLRDIEVNSGENRAIEVLQNAL